MKELKAQIRSKNFEKTYLFSGEAYLKDIYEQRLKKSVLSEAFFEMNFNSYEGNKLDVSMLLDLANTMPFMDNYRLIVVKKSGFFSGKNETAVELMTALEQIPSSTIVVFIEETVDKRTKVYKAFTKIGKAVEFGALSESDLMDWVQEGFKKKGVGISVADAQYFLKRVSTDMYMIENELEKLAAYVADTGQVTRAVIDEVATVSVEAKIFDLTKALGDKNVKVAVEIYNQLLTSKTEPLMILVMIARQFRLILRVKSLKDRREEDIAKLVDTKTFVVRECLRQSSQFKYQTLMDALADCLKTDVGIKRGEVEAKLGVELLLFKYGR